MNYQELIDRITKAILDNLQTALKDYTKCDRTYKGYVSEIINAKKYKVVVNGKTYAASSSIECQLNDYVWLCEPCGNANNAFIICKTK